MPAVFYPANIIKTLFPVKGKRTCSREPNARMLERKATMKLPIT
jgi:hypothetical protein